MRVFNNDFSERNENCTFAVYLSRLLSINPRTKEGLECTSKYGTETCLQELNLTPNTFLC